jgi:hypothetical protein
MTPKEAANETSRAGTNPSPEVDDFLVNASARELQEFIHLHSAMLYTHWLERAKVAVNIRLAEEHAKSADTLIKHSEKLTHQTDKMIDESINLSKLTKVLIWLTVALGGFAVVQIVLMVYDIWKHK